VKAEVAKGRGQELARSSAQEMSGRKRWATDIQSNRFREILPAASAGRWPRPEQASRNVGRPDLWAARRSARISLDSGTGSRL
jgi:hypothetical protein